MGIRYLNARTPFIVRDKTPRQVNVELVQQCGHCGASTFKWPCPGCGKEGAKCEKKKPKQEELGA